jgi:hypothetical protein
MGQGRAIWLLSDGRSGSTWFAQVLNFAGQMHVEHEPVHSLFNPRLAGEPLLPMPASAPLESVYAPLIDDVLGGRHVSRRFEPARPELAERQGVIVRDIHGLLIAPMLLPRFPALRPVVIVRHPVAVAQSKLGLSDWQWFSAIERFGDDAMIVAQLGGLTRWIERADTLFRRYVVHWAVCHRWFFAQCWDRPVTLVRYPLMERGAARAVAGILGGDPFAVAGAAGFAQAFHQRSATDQPEAGRGLLTRVLGERGPTRAERQFAEDAIDDFGLRWMFGGEPSVVVPARRGRQAQAAWSLTGLG